MIRQGILKNKVRGLSIYQDLYSYNDLNILVLGYRQTNRTIQQKTESRESRDRPTLQSHLIYDKGATAVKAGNLHGKNIIWLFPLTAVKSFPYK